MSSVIWNGAETLRADLTPIENIEFDRAAVVGDQEAVRRGLEIFGQQRHVLTASNGKDVSYRGHLVAAALDLGWTHIATRLEVAEETGGDPGQMTLLDEVAKTSEGLDRASLIDSLAADNNRASIEQINRESADPDHEWIGLPEFIPVDEPAKVVISCDTEEERDALFDVLGIDTIHKGTRGTLSVWWPDRERKDLASLRFRAGERAA